MSIAVPEENTDTIYPPRIFQEWLDKNSPLDLHEKLKEKVMGQDEELRKAAILIYGFITAMANSHFDNSFHFLIEGASGCGKSTFAYRLQEILPCPVIVADGASITPAGYRGADVSDLLSSQELDRFCGCGVLVVDELDKLMQPTYSSEGNFHQESLHTFLKLLDGGTITTRSGDQYLCNKLLVIGIGAFTPLRQPHSNIDRRYIGFCPDMRSTAPQAAQRVANNMITKELMSDFCGSEQFLGRFLTVLHFKKLDKRTFLNIILQTESEIRKIYGCGFRLSQEERFSLIDKAMTTDFGARSVKSAVWEAFLASEIDWVAPKEDGLPKQSFDDSFEQNMAQLLGA